MLQTIIKKRINNFKTLVSEKNDPLEALNEKSKYLINESSTLQSQLLKKDQIYFIMIQ